MNKSKLYKNVISGFGGQLVVIILGLIVPRFLITRYGSDINGLIGTVTQIFTYMALLEAGIGQAAKNLLYEPIKKNNTDKSNAVLAVANSYFRRITVYYAVGVLLLAFGLPIVVKTNASFITVFLIVLLEGLSGVITFFYVQTPTILLSVDGKNYINNGINIVSKVTVYVLKIVLAFWGINIVLVQFSCFIINFIKVIIYRIYIYINYSWINLTHTDNEIKLKDRNSFVLTEIAWTIFSSTDMIVLSMFVSTQVASVYSIYNMIFTNLNVLLSAVYNSVNYILGYSYHENLKKYEKILNTICINCNIITINSSISRNTRKRW